jgi:hypothetical protein
MDVAEPTEGARVPLWPVSEALVKCLVDSICID